MVNSRRHRKRKFCVCIHARAHVCVSVSFSLWVLPRENGLSLTRKILFGSLMGYGSENCGIPILHLACCPLGSLSQIQQHTAASQRPINLFKLGRVDPMELQIAFLACRCDAFPRNGAVRVLR